MGWGSQWVGDRFGRDDRSDRGAARAVVFHHELLHGNPRTPRQLANDEARLGIRGVPLVVVRLDDGTFIQLGCVVRLVFVGVVWVNCMRNLQSVHLGAWRRWRSDGEAAVGGGRRRVAWEVGGSTGLRAQRVGWVF